MNERRLRDRGRGRSRRHSDERYAGYYEHQRRHEHERGYYELQHPPARRRSRRRRSLWPARLAGCALGVLVTLLAAAVVIFLVLRTSQGTAPVSIPGLGNGQSFTHDDSMPVTLPTTLTHLQICDKIGNISLNVDTNRDTATVATHKIVHAANQADADQEFGRIKVEVQPPATISQPLTCTGSTTQGSSTTSGNGTMIVNATVPDNQSLVHGPADSVDLSVTLPQKALPGDPSLTLTIETVAGNITVDGLRGVLNVKGTSGNINVTHAILADGSHIETNQGNITFNGLLANANGAQSRYTLLSEQGNIDVTLPSDTNLTLDSDTNSGEISSEFGTNVQNNGSNGIVNYHGPLNSSVGPPANAAELILHVSTGNITIHKAQI
ncbi:MAG: DUF4097 family beta strand repeat protein [Ktedonobacteraceae bacterium]|nr:DUF4097 family beta strand repeat protein [Ktedonobacteraceae bacterium]